VLVPVFYALVERLRATTKLLIRKPASSSASE
jgi:hypothetical protein